MLAIIHEHSSNSKDINAIKIPPLQPNDSIYDIIWNPVILELTNNIEIKVKNRSNDEAILLEAGDFLEKFTINNFPIKITKGINRNQTLLPEKETHARAINQKKPLEN